MKKYLTLALVASLLMVAPASYAYNGPYDVGEIKGTPRKQGEPVRTFKLIRFSTRGANIASIASNDVVVYDTNSDDSVSIRTTTTSADASVAGVVASVTIQTADSDSTTAFSDAGKRNWGYILVHGPAKVKIAAGGTNGNSIGDIWITSTDAGSATTFQSFDTSTVAQNMNRIVKAAGAGGGFFYDAADGSSTTAEVFVKLE